MRLWLHRALACACLGLLSCADTHSSAFDKKTDWLQACGGDSDCAGNFECVCGLCTARCNSNAQCAELADRGVCVATSAIAQDCGGDGRAPSRVCSLACDEGADCAAWHDVLACVEGVCGAERTMAPSAIDDGEVRTGSEAGVDSSIDSGVGPSVGTPSGDALVPSGQDAQAPVELEPSPTDMSIADAQSDAESETQTDAGSDPALDAGSSGSPDAGGRWQLAASMTQGRTQHGAVLLHSGRVLVAGGIGMQAGGAADLASVELYDPLTNTWLQAAPLGAARSGPGTALLPDGRVLVVGGSYQGFALASAELYDPETDNWSPTGSPLVTLGGAVTVLTSGEVLLVGGEGTSPAELYDPATGMWSLTGEVAYPRWGHATTLLADGKVLLSGGFSWEPFAPAVLETELYDPASGMWSPAGALDVFRNGAAPILLASGRVLVSGGYPQAPSPMPQPSTELYDPATNMWLRGTDLLTPRWIHSTTRLADGRVLAAGGSVEAGALTSTELYDEATATWSSGPALSVARWSHSATTLLDGRVLVVGGYDLVSYLSSAELYTPGVASDVDDDSGTDAGTSDAGIDATTNASADEDAAGDSCEPTGSPVNCGAAACTACAGLIACCVDPDLSLCGTTALGSGICAPG